MKLAAGRVSNTLEITNARIVNPKIIEKEE